jgi:hypothetical protein
MYLNSYVGEMAIISRPKLTGFGEHWGVQLPNGMVAHNTDTRGEHVVPYQEFAAGKEVKTIRSVPPELWQLALQRIHQEISNPNGYHVLENNCEIFANRVTGHAPESPQVKGLFILALAGLACWAMTAS